MAAKTAEKFSSYLLTSERELAQEVTTSLLTKGSIVINIFFLSQLLFLTGKVTQNHAIATIFIICSLLLSIRLMKKFQSNNPIIINQICLLMLPIYIDNSITKPWVSYGLLCAIFVLLAAGLDNRPLFITALLVTPFLQFFVANLNLLGVIDSQDLLFLNSYFSTLWVIIAGVGVRIARNSYFKYCDQIDEELFGLQQRLLEDGKSQTQLNLKDYKNIALHGTVLNTLISYNNITDLDQKRNQLAIDLTQDISKIESAEQATTTNVPFIKILDSNLSQYEIKLKFNIDSKLILESYLVEPTLEIIREVVLNTKKHTNSQIIEIELVNNQSELQVRIYEVLNESLSYAQLDSRLVAANSSKTLLRLTNRSEVTLKISGSTQKNALIYDVKIAKTSKPIDALRRIETLRASSLIKNVQLLSLVSVFYSYLAIIGFIVASVPIYIILTIAISAALLTYELSRSKKSTWRPVLSQILLITVIPYVIFTDESCQNLLYTPWLFNAIVGSVLYGIAVLNNPIFKWLPALVFIAENTRTRWVFPEECKTLLDGSTPGFIFILIFGFLMARLRQRNTRLDKELDNSLISQIEQSKKTSILVDHERNLIIEDLKLFAKNLNSSQISAEELKYRIKLIIQKIRVFLICSEHFSSPFIQALYKFASGRIESGSPIRISIYALQITDNYPFDFVLLEQLNAQTVGKDVELVITDNENLELEYFVENDVIASFKLTN